jgi:hypothetical protein
MMNRLSGHMSTKIETKHILGCHVPEDHVWIMKENEWKIFVNARESGLSLEQGLLVPRKENPINFPPNSVEYFFQDSIKGDVCNH